jgi:pyruvate-formate lyase
LVSGALNLDVDRKQFAGEEKERTFAALLATYFNHGGLHAQVTSLDPNELIEAQKTPALYRDLRVRVTGYSGVFVDIPTRLQNDIIKRLQ